MLLIMQFDPTIELWPFVVYIGITLLTYMDWYFNS